MKMDKKIWYAVLRDDEDNDWGHGSCNYHEAVKMARNMGEGARIAVIDDREKICEEIIMQEDF